MLYLQSVGICHRDLKLQNLLLDADQRTLKLSDFGTAVVVRACCCAFQSSKRLFLLELVECPVRAFKQHLVGLFVVGGTTGRDDERCRCGYALYVVRKRSFYAIYI